MKSRKTVRCKTVHILNNCETLGDTVLKKYFYKEFFMKKWKKTAVFSALAVLVCAAVQAVSPDELLLQAVKDQNRDVLKEAIKQNANVNYMDSDDKTVLMYACERQWYEGVKVLLEEGANASFKNGYDQTALMFAAKDCDNETILKMLIKRNANINDYDKRGKTVLMYAIENKSSVAVDYLLRNGVNTNTTDVDGYDAFMWAVKNRNHDAAQRIFSSSSSINWNQCDMSGSNAFMLACENGDLFLVRMMLTGNNAFDLEWKSRNSGQPILIWLIDKRKSNEIIKYIMGFCNPKESILYMADDFGNDVEYYANMTNNDFVLDKLDEIKRNVKAAKQATEAKRAERAKERNR